MAGNALHKMFGFIHPHVKHVVTASLDVKADDADAGGARLADDPGTHIRRQAERISQGKPVDCVTALLIEQADGGKEGNGFSRSEEP